MRKTNNVNEVELSYFNEIDEHNKFKGLIKFPDVYCVKFANVLCKDEEMVKEYLSKYYNPEFEQYEVINSLQQFKKDIRDRREDVSKYKEKIKTCIETENREWLWVVLQDLFLEPLYKWQLESIVKLIHNGVNEDDIMKWYEKGKKILAMTTFEVEYIKEI
jgi:glutaredoxin-related protein